MQIIADGHHQRLPNGSISRGPDSTTNSTERGWQGPATTLAPAATSRTCSSSLESACLVDLFGSIEGRYQHLIVDEVQDIRPAEWLILSALLSTRRARWSLFGDMNQRRADSHVSRLGSTSSRMYSNSIEATGLNSDTRVLATGYRSTRQILRYASGLLSPGQPSPVALRDGPDPTTPTESARRQLISAAHEEAERLADEFPGGTVAVIAWDVDQAQRDPISLPQGRLETSRR